MGGEKEAEVLRLERRIGEEVGGWVKGRRC